MSKRQETGVRTQESEVKRRLLLIPNSDSWLLNSDSLF